MKYSIVIPTRRRVDTLRHSIMTVLSIPRDDFELIVHHAGPDPDTDELIAGIQDPRVRYFASEKETSMRDNWESAIAQVRGDYVTIIGDDDGLLPDALETADILLAEHESELLSWRPVTYHWPNFLFAPLAGRVLHVYDLCRSDVHRSSQAALREVYAFRSDYSDLAMIYNSFVSRRLIERIKEKFGTYFQLNYPDVTSGVIHAACTKSFLWSNYPLTISGLSANSTGTRIAFKVDGQMERRADAEGGFKIRHHEMFGEMPTLPFRVANELAMLHKQLNLSEAGILLRPGPVADYLARTLKIYPDHLAEAQEALAAFCRKNGVDFGQLMQNYDLSAIGSPEDAFIIAEDPSVVLIRHDLRPEGVEDIAGAAPSISRLLGPRRHSKMPAAGPSMEVVEVGGAKLEWIMSSSGLAAQILGEGWHQSEAFGTWAAEPRASLVFPEFMAAEGCRICLTFHLRAPLLPQHPKLPFSLSSASGFSLFEGEIGPLANTLSLDCEFDLEPSGSTRTLVIELKSGVMVNPAKMGISTDNRRLGIGVEWVSLSLKSRVH